VETQLQQVLLVAAVEMVRLELTVAAAAAALVG
jgi:hypothetical protein